MTKKLRKENDMMTNAKPWTIAPNDSGSVVLVIDIDKSP